MSVSLAGAFGEVCNFFNRGNYNDLAKRCDTDVIMKKVDDAGSIVGLGNFITYLNTHQASQNPKIEKIDVDKEIVDPSETFGQVSGTAEYRDKATDKTTLAIRFTFTFTRADKDSDWILINAFAAAR